MTGFSDTAAFFEAKAQKARTSDVQQRFLETAGFYRALSQITPVLPPGYKTPKIKLNGSFRADRLHSRAEECRAIAAVTWDRNCRAMLARLAETYEELALRCGRD